MQTLHIPVITISNCSQPLISVCHMSLGLKLVVKEMLSLNGFTKASIVSMSVSESGLNRTGCIYMHSY